ncbi:hypothetical protein CF166_00135 [Amycolatopsis sp. KNN50.9b]|nr:hypothetical protein CF166_00135 [Amycolatopsis sp. KNN50.9b]
MAADLERRRHHAAPAGHGSPSAGPGACDRSDDQPEHDSSRRLGGRRAGPASRGRVRRPHGPDPGPGPLRRGRCAVAPQPCWPPTSAAFATTRARPRSPAGPRKEADLHGCVFVGPTLGAGEAERVAGLTALPPASAGDVYRAVEAGYRTLLLIDGYFHQVPSVQHKEILYALHQGLAVFGCSSMGALRAAELADFGMVGIGRVFRRTVTALSPTTTRLPSPMVTPVPATRPCPCRW